MKKIGILALQAVSLSIIIPLLGNAQCTTTGPELVTNGGFEICSPSPCSGGTVTSSQTDYSPDYYGSNCPPGVWGGAYAIVSDASACYFDWLPAANTAHTGTYAMLIDGNGNSQMWCQTVAVTVGTTYEFSAWYQNAVRSGAIPGEIPEIQLYINGAPITINTAVVSHMGGWDQNKCLWQAPAATTTANICINLVATSSSSGNDVLIDDISFKAVTGGSCTSGSCSFTGPSAVLPVELLSFHVLRNGTNVYLDWTTITEKNTSYFIIEKSTDGNHFFETSETMLAQGNSSVPVQYEYKEEQVDFNYYYRLKIIDVDGAIHFSPIQIASAVTEFANILQTNSGELILRASVLKETDWNLSIHSLLGQKFLEEKIKMTSGDQLVYRANDTGVKHPCIVRITNMNGDTILSEIILW